MEIIYPVGNDASNIQVTAQKRLLRVVQGQTQATPTSGYLDPSLRSITGGIRVPKSTDKAGVVGTEPTAAAPSPFEREVTAFTYEGSIVPGTCMVKTAGENYAVADGKKNEGVIAGLLGQWLGGTFDGVKQNNQISVWQGPDSYYDVLAPAFGTIGAETNKENEEGKPVYLYAGGDGRLTTTESKSKQKVAEVVEYNPSVLRIRLLI